MILKDKHMKIKGIAKVIEKEDKSGIELRYQTTIPKTLTNSVDYMELLEILGFIIIQPLIRFYDVLLPPGWFHGKFNKKQYLIDEKGRIRFTIDNKNKTITCIHRYNFELVYRTEGNILKAMDIFLLHDDGDRESMGIDINIEDFNNNISLNESIHDVVKEYEKVVVTNIANSIDNLTTSWDEVGGGSHERQCNHFPS